MREKWGRLMNLRNDPFRESRAKAVGARATEAFRALIAGIAGGFDTDFGLAAFAAGAIRGTGASDAESAFAAAKTRTGKHVCVEAGHVRAVVGIFAVFGNEVTCADAANLIARFAGGIARAVAADAIGAEEVRCAILNDVAFQALYTGCATIAAAIDVGFVAVLYTVTALEARIRFGIAKDTRLTAIRVGIAFDAIAFTVAGIPANRTSRALRGRRFDFHARRTGGHVTIVFGGIRIVIDGFFATLSVALHFLAIANHLRLQFLPIGRRRLAADFIKVTGPGQTWGRNTTLVPGHAPTAFTRSRANEVIVETTRKACGEDMRIGLPFTTFQRARIVIIRCGSAGTLQCGIQTIPLDIVHFIGTARALQTRDTQKRGQQNPSLTIRRTHVRVLHPLRRNR